MQYLAPEITQKTQYGDTVTTFNHDAYGMIGAFVVTGGDGVLFGSDLNHGQQVRISIKRAKQDRTLAHDWFHATEEVIEVSLSHTQFAEMITSMNRGDGVPCTINRAPERGTSLKSMPGIIKPESKAETYRNEIKKSAKEQMVKIGASLAKIEAMLESGSLSKKELREAVFNMKCHIENTPSNMEYVVKSAEEALGKAVTSAKIDVEAYINHAINQLGVEAAKNLGLTTNAAQSFLTIEADA